MPAGVAEILEAEQRCAAAGAAFAAAVNAGAPPADIDAAHAALMRAAGDLAAMKGEALPGDHQRPQPAPPPPAPPPSTRIMARPTIPGPPASKPMGDLFG